jgi:hypothetical protein
MRETLTPPIENFLHGILLWILGSRLGARSPSERFRPQGFRVRGDYTGELQLGKAKISTGANAINWQSTSAGSAPYGVTS